MNVRKQVFDELLRGRHCCDAIQTATGLSQRRVQRALDFFAAEGITHAVGRVQVAAGRAGPQTLWAVRLGREGWEPRPEGRQRARRAKAPRDVFRPAPSVNPGLGVFAGLLR